MAALYDLDVEQDKALSLDIRYAWFELAQDVVVGPLNGEKMNAARLTRRWQEAAGDPARMAEALIEELDLTSAGTAPTRPHG